MNPLETCRMRADEMNVKRLVFTTPYAAVDPEVGGRVVPGRHRIDLIYDRDADALDLHVAGRAIGKPDLAGRLFRDVTLPALGAAR